MTWMLVETGVGLCAWDCRPAEGPEVRPHGIDEQRSVGRNRGSAEMHVAARFHPASLSSPFSFPLSISQLCLDWAAIPGWRARFHARRSISCPRPMILRFRLNFPPARPYLSRLLPLISCGMLEYGSRIILLDTQTTPFGRPEDALRLKRTP